MVTGGLGSIRLYAQASFTPLFIFYQDSDNSVRIVLELGDTRFDFLLAKMEAKQEGGKNSEQKQQELEEFFHGSLFN